MSSIRLIGYSLAIAVGVGAVFASAATAGAAFLPTTRFAINHVQHVDCAVGAHIGPLGACIFGSPYSDNRRAVDAPREGCSTQTVERTDGMGDSVAKSRTECD